MTAQRLNDTLIFKYMKPKIIYQVDAFTAEPFKGYQTGMVRKDKTITFDSGAGDLFVRKSGNWIIMDFPAYQVERVQIPPIAEKLIGIKPAELYRTSHGWTLALLHNEDDVRNLKPDFNQMKDSPFGDLIVTAPSEDTNFDFCVRCFAPALGIDEDPVTG